MAKKVTTKEHARSIKEVWPFGLTLAWSITTCDKQKVSRINLDMQPRKQWMRGVYEIYSKIS